MFVPQVVFSVKSPNIRIRCTLTLLPSEEGGGDAELYQRVASFTESALLDYAYQ